MSERLAPALGAVRARWSEPSRLAVVLGSGFSSAASSWPVSGRIAYDEIPDFPRCRIPGHVGELLAVDTAGGPVVAFSGRLHAYEGQSPESVVFPVDLAAALGAGVLVLTCAAGGIRDDLAPGSLALVVDHLNLAGWTPPTGPGRFLDLSEVYDRRLRDTAREAAAAAGPVLGEGVLACVRGPAYETPAEIRMLARLGADMVCMSTVPEAIRARALGMKVLALACIANRAAGLTRRELDHREVLESVASAVTRHSGWLLEICGRLATRAGEG
jgi:purine-nucleoside phosphorylase